jgi:hypothetical protein
VTDKIIGNDLFVDMMNWGFINQGHQFKQGMLMNDEGKRLHIKQVFPKKSPNFIDVYIQYAHVVPINGKFKTDPAVILGFDLKNKVIYPVLYRNDLLDHTINVYETGGINQDNADWLLEYWSAWFNELKSDEYEYIEQAQLMAG